MQKSLKHLLSLALVIVLVLSCIGMVTLAADEAPVAVNAATGTQYDNLTDALFDAAEGQTVQLAQDVTDLMTTVFEGVTLDLNGYNLTTKYMSCYGDLIDSSEANSGLLCVDASRFMLREQNRQLTVKTAEGYRFVEITGFNTAMLSSTKYAFQPLFEADALELLAQGNAVTGITVRVHVSWMQEQGARTQDFTYNDSHLIGFAESYKEATGKFGKMFALTLNGAEDFQQLTFTAQVVSDTGVCFAPAPVQEEPESGKGDVTTNENGELVGDLTLENSNASAFVAEGTQLEAGTTTLVLTTDALTKTGSDVTLQDGESMVSMDVHVEGISKDNTVPVIVTLDQLAPEALNQGNITLYHVENGETVAMTRVYSMDALDAHNEYYYDIPTGTVTVALVSFSEVAVVANVENPWGGEKDISWYNTQSTTFTIYNADQLAGFGSLVDGGNTFAGKTIKLGFDINLYGTYVHAEEGTIRRSFDPIGYDYGVYFSGTFDGQGHTIYNLYQNGWDLGYSYSTEGGGLFASVRNANFYNVNLDHADIVMECVDMGTLVGYAYGNCHFENIIVSGSTVQNYNRYTGGVVGEVNGNHTFINVDVDADTTLSALWGTFDPSIGGIIGGKYGTATVHMENCDVACKLDVYNDVTSAYRWYSYRRCGMLIGYTEESKTVNGRTEATASFLTTKNCTVQYGDWANYHYCEFSNEYYPFVRVEAGLSNSAYSNPRYGHPKGADGKTLVTVENHSDAMHQTGEACTMLATFHQLYGGGQGCYGGNDHVGKGVTVLNGIESATKFDKKVNDGFVVYKDRTYTLGELFAAAQLDPEKNLGIQTLSLNAFVSPTAIEGSAGGTFIRSNTWENSTLAFTGVGEAIITIDDYYYCDPTVLKIYIAPNFSLNVQPQYSNTTADGQTQYALYLNTDEAVTLGDYTFTLGLENATYHAFEGQTISENTVSWQHPQDAITVDAHHIYLGSFTAPTAATVTKDVLQDVQVEALFGTVEVPGKVTVSTGYFHDAAHTGWTAWKSTTSLPTTSGKYYLTADVTLSTQAAYDHQDITLCLNGHDITVNCTDYATNTAGNRSRVYSVGMESVLALCDCQAKLDANGNYDAGRLSGGHQGLIIVPNTSEHQNDFHARIYLYDGIIGGAQLRTSGGAVVIQRNSTFNMYGGQIAGNVNEGNLDATTGLYSDDHGGGMFISNSVFNMYGGKICNNTSTRGGGIWASGNAIINLYGGEISGNTAYYNPGNTDLTNEKATNGKGFGGGIYISDAANDTDGMKTTLNMYGGAIKNNFAIANGGGISALRSVLNLYGGKISGNIAQGTEENVIATQAETSEGGTGTAIPEEGGGGDDIVDDNTTSKRIRSGTGYGAAIYMSATTAQLEDLLITDNTASHAAMFITGSSNAYLKNVTMTGNQCHSTGAMALYAESSSYCTVEDGLITGNTSIGTYGNSCAAIYIPNDATTLKLVGAPKIFGNFRDADERNIYLQNTVYENSEDEALRKIGHAKLTLGALTDGAITSVITQYGYLSDNTRDDLEWLVYEPSIVENWDGNWVKYVNAGGNAILADTENQKLYLSTHTSKSHDGYSSWQAFGVSAAERVSLPSESGHYYLVSDIEMADLGQYYDTSIQANRDVGVMLDNDQEIVLCLNGHNIKAYSRLYRMSGNAKVTICDCTKAGQITAGGSYTLNGQIFHIPGAVIYTAAGSNTTVNVKNVTIVGDSTKTVTYGGAFCINGTSCNMTLNNVTLQNMSSGYQEGNTKCGSAIYMTAGGSLNITGCTFENCESTVGSGGAIYASKAALTVNNSKFTNCTSASNGGAICIADTATATITGDSSANNSSYFSSCSAAENGGAIYNASTAANALTVSGTNFESCSAAIGGAICNAENTLNGTVAVSGSSFKKCSASNTAGVLFASTRATDYRIELTDVVIEEASSRYVSAIYANSTTKAGVLKLTRVSINGCTTTAAATDQNTTTTIFCQRLDSVVMDTCSFTNNTITKAGGSAVYFNRVDDAQLISCTATGNTCSNEASSVGAIYLTNAVNLTVSGNTNISDNTRIFGTLPLANIFIQKNSASDDNTSFQSNVVFKDVDPASTIGIRLDSGISGQGINGSCRVDDADQVTFTITYDNDSGAVYTYNTETRVFNKTTA